MLDQIVSSVVARMPEVEAKHSVPPEPRRDRRSFRAGLTGPGLSVIAEIKRRSPSRGLLNPDLDPAGQARHYEAGGATAISVLTERDHFAGSPEDLEQVRSAVELPVLRKDFIVHEAQLWESVAIGADAVLLIVAILDDPVLRRLIAEAGNLGLDSLVEVHSGAEVHRALDAGAEIIGVNNRDLQTFAVDLGTAEQLAAQLSRAEVKVAESGIHSAADATRMKAAGYDAVLVGESLVKAPDPAALLSELKAAG